jgi:hypothetical protein
VAPKSSTVAARMASATDSIVASMLVPVSPSARVHVEIVDLLATRPQVLERVGAPPA